MTKLRGLILILCVVTVLASAGAFLDARRTIASKQRGIEDATSDTPLPEKLPLAGVNVELTQYDATQLPQQLEAIQARGFHWVRQMVLWQEVEPQQGQWDWSTYDPIIEAVSQYPDLELVLVLNGTPDWARHAHAPEHPFAPPASVQAYADFTRAVAERYGDRVSYYQIWDEPNIRTQWGNLDPRPATYTAMLKQSYTVIHEADASATVIMAALAPNIETGPENLSDVLFLQAVYAEGGKDYFDAAAGKPYGFNLPPNDTVDGGKTNFSRLILLREEMVRQGDGDKALWGSNFGWNHLPDAWTGTPSIWGAVSAEQQVQFTYEAYQRAAQEWAWVGGLILEHWQPDAPTDDPRQGFAIAPQLDRWQAPFVPSDTLTAGRYPAAHPTIDYSEGWELSDLGADVASDAPAENTITIPFEGTAFAINVRKDDYLAYLTVTVDGQPANALPRNQQGDAYIVLTSETRQPEVKMIQVAEGLAPGKHVAVITLRPALGDDRWSIAGFAVANIPSTQSKTRQQYLAVLVGLAALIAGVGVASGIGWHKLRPPSRQALINLGDWLLTYLVSAIFVVGLVLSWDGMLTYFLRRDPPAFIASITTMSILYFSPNVWLSLVGLMVFAVIVFNRPLLGLLAVAFWSMFFTATLDVHLRVIATVEVMLAITTAAILGRGLLEWARLYRQDKRVAWAQLLKIQLSALDVAIVAFVGLALLSLTWVELLPEALRELRTMILAPAVFYLLLRVSRLPRREWAFLVDVVMFGGICLALTGLYNYFSGDYVVYSEGTRRLIGIYGSPNSVALHLGRCIPFALAYLVFTEGWRLLYGMVAASVMLIALILTQSVGGIILGLPAALVILVLAWQGKKALLPVVGVGLAGAVALIPLASVIPRLKNLSNPNSTTALFRVNLWRSTAEMLKDHPITGVGLDQFLYAYRGRYILPEAWADPDLSHPHNWILDYWVRLGILGVVLGVAMQILFWRTAYRAVQQQDRLGKALLVGAMGSMAAFVAHGLVDSAYFAINLSYIFMILVALVQGIRPESEA